MNAIIPDTLEGALILSVIDFFLSFFVISFVGVVLAGFPLLNRAGAWIEEQSRARAAARKKAAIPPPAESQEIPLEHIAVIAAAVSAMIESHRILRIEPQPHGKGWTAEGRLAHHLSHAPIHHKRH